MQGSPEILLSANQLQLASFEMGRNLSARIEGAADNIIAESTDPVVRRNALLWKISAIPLVQEAAVRIDPQVAAMDLLAFTIQQLDYLTIGSGRNSFGPQQAIAVDATREAQREAIALVSSALRSGKLPAPCEAASCQRPARRTCGNGRPLTRCPARHSGVCQYSPRTGRRSA